MLPTIAIPTFEVKLPSTEKKIKLRPFLVKEEKLLLMAAQSKEQSEIINTTKDVIAACILDSTNINDLTFFDIDYLFVVLRARSIGESVEVEMTCNHVNDNGDRCGQIFPIEVDITKIHIVKDKKLANKIMLTDDVGVQMKYPKYNTVKAIMTDPNVYERRINLICASIDFIYDKEKVYSTKDYLKEDLLKFLDNLTKEQEEKLGVWIDNFPYMELRISKACPRCKFNHELTYKDFTSFFF